MAVVAVIGTVVISLVVLGSPAAERMRRLDDRRVQNLRGIASAVNVYWNRRERVPPSLGELSREPDLDITFHDPATGVSYEYHPLDAKRYELCATFQSESNTRRPTAGGDFWSHQAGRQCFQLQAEKFRRRRRRR